MSLFSNTLIPNTENINFLCAVCVSDRSGAQIALTIILLSLVVLFLFNWGWKKYLKKSKYNIFLDK